jgi:hypothetical protein
MLHKYTGKVRCFISVKTDFELLGHVRFTGSSH